MRRQDRKMQGEETLELLTRGEYGILSTLDSNSQPYGVPLSYVYLDNNIYFHCATEGYKMDNIKNNPRVSFCVVGQVQAIPEKFTTKYESVIAFGKATEIDGEEKEAALMAIIEKYSSSYIQEGRAYIARSKDKVSIVKIAIDSITGKAGK